MSVSTKIDHATVLVTGATGFIGSHLVDLLLSRGCEVHCVVRKTSDLRWLDRKRVHLITVDLNQPGVLDRYLERFDFVFHCAGLTKAKSQQEYFRTNAKACTHLYESCVARGKRLQAVVHLSSLAAVGPGTQERPVDENTACEPLTFYGKSKLAGESIAEKFTSSLPINILRPPVVYGPREKNFLNYLKAAHRGWLFKVGKARKTLSLIHVHDLVRGMVEATNHSVPEKNIFFLTDGQVYSWEEVAETVTRILNIQIKTLVISESTLKFIAVICETVARFGPNAPLLDRQRVIDMCQNSWTADTNKFFNCYEFQPQYDLYKGLSETLEWYRKHQWL